MSFHNENETKEKKHRAAPAVNGTETSYPLVPQSFATPSSFPIPPVETSPVDFRIGSHRTPIIDIAANELLAKASFPFQGEIQRSYFRFITT